MKASAHCLWKKQWNPEESGPALAAPVHHLSQPGLGFPTAGKSLGPGAGATCSALLHSHGANESDVKPESQTVNQPGMQHVEFEWDFYPERQRAVIAGEAEQGLPGEKRGIRVLRLEGPTRLPWEENSA